MKMISKTRPKSSSTCFGQIVPQRVNSNQDNQHLTIDVNGKILSNLIPDMPALTTKNRNSTALLYSKFIIKGIKTNKIDLVRESFNMKKQNYRYQKKMSLNMMKTIKSRRNPTKDEVLRSIRNEANQQTQFAQKSLFISESKMLNLEINNYFRMNSNDKKVDQNGTQRKMKKTQSENVLKRPKSAVCSPYTHIRSDRARTANFRKTANPNRQTFNDNQFKATIPEKNILTIITAQASQVGFKNHIERNKRQLSASSKKTSFYLTGVERNKSPEHLFKQMKKVPIKKYQQALKSHSNKKIVYQPPSEKCSELKLNRLSYNQIEQIKKRNKANSSFMKENMPHQYKKFIQYLFMSQNNYTEKDRVLLSISLENNKNQFGQINLNFKNEDQAMNQTKEYFIQYAHICEETGYHIKKNLKKKQQTKTFNQILHVGTCQQLLELQRSKISLSQNQKDGLTQINLRIYQIVKIFQFFKSKSPQICKKMFSLNFHIISMEQDANIIRKGDQIGFFYLILNGSVVKENTKKLSQDNQDQRCNTIKQANIYTTTLFDGQTFGELENPFQLVHKNNFKSAEKLLLMSFPYFQYKKICAYNQNIQERIELLKNIFGNVPDSKQLTNENFEALAFQLQSKSYDAKNIIFRKGDICDKLIIVASGKITVLDQHILKRTKKVSKDMKEKRKSSQRLKLKSYSVQKLRKSNLKNYEILGQNQEEFVFYYQDVSKQLIQGDVVNWQGFSHNYRKSNQQDDEKDDLKVQKLDKFPLDHLQPKLEYSLISNTDNTKIYTLDMKRIKNLLQHLKQAIYFKIDDVFKVKTKQKSSKIQGQKFESAQKWDLYKQKVCNQIISRKLKL